jgi:hypothetical protein
MTLVIPLKEIRIPSISFEQVICTPETIVHKEYHRKKDRPEAERLTSSTILMLATGSTVAQYCI